MTSGRRPPDRLTPDDLEIRDRVPVDLVEWGVLRGGRIRRVRGPRHLLAGGRPWETCRGHKEADHRDKERGTVGHRLPHLDPSATRPERRTQGPNEECRVTPNEERLLGRPTDRLTPDDLEIRDRVPVDLVEWGVLRGGRIRRVRGPRHLLAGGRPWETCRGHKEADHRDKERGTVGHRLPHLDPSATRPERRTQGPNEECRVTPNEERLLGRPTAWRPRAPQRASRPA